MEARSTFFGGALPRRQAEREEKRGKGSFRGAVGATRQGQRAKGRRGTRGR